MLSSVTATGTARMNGALLRSFAFGSRISVLARHTDHTIASISTAQTPLLSNLRHTRRQVRPVTRATSTSHPSVGGSATVLETQQLPPRVTQQLPPRVTQQLPPRVTQQLPPRVTQQLPPRVTQSDLDAWATKKWPWCSDSDPLSPSAHHAPTNDGTQAPFTVVLPPPNVTGVLHLGHALTFTLQDVLVRWHRMRGRDILWEPGMDHAGIATQVIVEKQLAQGGESLRSVGRDEFIKRVWQWKNKSGGKIAEQLGVLGMSLDWKTTKFTMDEEVSAAVRKAFVTLYEQGLIYRDKRLVNWDPVMKTAVSDLEVVQKEVNGYMYRVKYPLQSPTEQATHVTIATTRPETMLGDTAVAVHPDDARTSHLIGARCIVPLTGRSVPIIGDDYVDIEKGTGALKVTPAHDFNDFDIGERHSLEIINILDENACISIEGPFHGMSVSDARVAVVSALEELGLVEGRDDHLMSVPRADRSNAVLEPWLTMQWFVDAAALAKPAVAAVNEGRTKFVPAMWTNTFHEWMRNIRPWCVSRQIVWGHRIPAYYGSDGQVFVAESSELALEMAREHYALKGSGERAMPLQLQQDEDVLDTWFSSALWPFVVPGWPDAIEDTAGKEKAAQRLAKHYPADVVVTGFDIIFFWVARMMMMSMHFAKDVPFRHVHIHALVRDASGNKMSKSKGNVIDPLQLASDYSPDALRFTLAAMSAPGRDVRLDVSRVAGFRSFGTKLWNAARYLDGCGASPRKLSHNPTPLMGMDATDLHWNGHGLKALQAQWLVTRVAQVIGDVDRSLQAWRFDDASSAVYQFIWGCICDTHIELLKQQIDGQHAEELLHVSSWAMGVALRLLHPFMPFVTEYLWYFLGYSRQQNGSVLALTPWPQLDAASLPMEYSQASSSVTFAEEAVSALRATRASHSLPKPLDLKLIVVSTDAALDSARQRHRWSETLQLVHSMLRTGEFAETPIHPSMLTSRAVQCVVSDITFALVPLHAQDGDDNMADTANLERQTLEASLKKAEKRVKQLSARLSAPGFTQRAKSDVVDDIRESLSSAEAKRNEIVEAIARLS